VRRSRVPTILKPTDVGSVVRRTEDQFRSTVVTRADVADIRFACDQDLCRAEVTELENARSRVQEEILRLNVSMTDSNRVDVGKRSEELIHVQLDLKHGHRLFELGIVPACAVHGLRNVFLDEIEVNFVLLRIARW
jgi:hypothetical protein